MPAPTFQPGSRRIAIALFSAAAVLVLLFALSLRLPPTSAPKSSANPPEAVTLAQLDKPSSDPLLREEAFLHDPSPLFLPTPWNTAQDVRPEESLRKPGDSFSRFPAKLQFGSGTVPLLLPPPVAIPAKPADELALKPWDRPFIGLGRTNLAPAVFPARSAELEVVSGIDGRTVLTMPLEGLPLPGDLLWQPAEFLLEADAAGPIGQPALVSSSGVESVDRLLQATLIRDWPLISQKGRLPAGLYDLVLGP